MARRLRIAVSVFFGLLTVALCVLWVRSYWWADILTASSPVKLHYVASSARGHLTCDLPKWKYLEDNEWNVESASPSGSVLSFIPRLSFYFGASGVSVGIPYLLPTMLCAVISRAIWLGRWRFSRRTMLIATTLVAVVLGIAAWAGR